VEKASLQTDKSIIDKSDENVAETLLRNTKITEGTPKTPEKAKRGRPPKKQKPVWNATAYKDNPIAETINKTLLIVINKGFLKDNPLKEGEIELGEAIAYTIDYYMEDIPITHPLFILLTVSILTVMTIYEKMPKKGTKKEEIHYIEKESESHDEKTR
jgi:hypothetical protein